MKIAVVQPRLSYFSGGGEKIPLESISHLVNILDNVSFDLYTTKSPLRPAPGYELFKAKAAKNKKINIYEIPTPKKYKPLYKIQPGENRYRWDAESLYFNNLVYDPINKNKPDIILSYYLLDCLFKPAGIHSMLYLLGYPRTESEYREAMLDQYDSILSITQNTLNQWNSRLATQIHSQGILHQGVDLTIKPKNVPHFRKHDFNIVFAGRLIQRKGIITLLDAIRILRQETKNIKLFILGDGPLLNDIKEFVEVNHLEDCVALEGFRSDVIDYINSANLCVFPSHEGEGLMNVVLESMFYNGLVITTYGNGNEEAITDNKNGFLVKPSDPTDLKDKIKYVIKNDPTLTKIQKKAKDTIVNNFSWENHAKSFYSICNKVLSNG